MYRHGWKRPIIIVAIGLFAACGTNDNGSDNRTDVSQTSNTPTSVVDAKDPELESQEVVIDLEPPIVIESLERLVDLSDFIFIGEVVGTGDVVNTFRDVNDINQPDPTLFGVGQVYRVEIDEYLKGQGPNEMNVVQTEGIKAGVRREKVEIPNSRPEIEALKHAFEGQFVPIEVGARYIFFVDPFYGFTPELRYHTSALGHPWKFKLLEDGSAVPESPAPSRVAETFPTRSVQDLRAEVEQLVQTNAK